MKSIDLRSSFYAIFRIIQDLVEQDHGVEVNDKDVAKEPLHYPVVQPTGDLLTPMDAMSADGQICTVEVPAQGAEQPQGFEHCIDQIDPKTQV
mgnify:CR=1 FL=1